MPVTEDVGCDDEAIPDDGLGGKPPAVDDRLNRFDDDIGHGLSPATLDGRCLGHRAECYWRSRPPVAIPAAATSS